jgi:hypothetical protein
MAYGVHTGGMALSARQGVDERYDILQFYWAQEEYLRAQQPGKSWSHGQSCDWLSYGACWGSPMNVIAGLGVYRAILREAGEALHCPRRATCDSVGEACNSDLVARCIAWAGMSDSARNEVFNVADGDAYTMASIWRAIADGLGMEVGEERAMRLAEAMARRARKWDRVRQRQGLVAPDTGQMFEKWFACFDRIGCFLPCVMGLAEQAQARSERWEYRSAVRTVGRQASGQVGHEQQNEVIDERAW